MRKLVAALSAGFLITSAAATTVSADANEHKVESGESLWKIADQYDTSVQKLLDINNLKTEVIHPKDVIKVSESAGEDGEETVYTVEKGDTLSAIAKEFNVSVSDIKEWNSLSSDIIVIGNELSINGAAEEAVAEEPAEEPATEEAAEEPAEEPAEEETTEEPAEEPAEESAPAEEESEPAQEEATVEQTSNEEASASESEEQSSDNGSPQGETISVEATAYTADCNGCSGVTATGVDLNQDPNAKVIAVDPSVIPLGSEVYVEGYGYATAADTGGAINGNKIDLHVPSQEEAVSFGRQQVNVTIVE
ncbi:3D domain-containing protein [Oceanobacillus jeddahense]|uniref:LysM peptidoglycan-binding domain-containing protein n=1 Tax=Oceanobacillus jeddahense TaxID=1462527 RepID=A0ABY5JVX0_9BACI|nr:LysM peptidoglycan-binding and 3D domain-containing protein [Oceanobacillus jeddahense]UUI02709.1 LysM peptidoglycan-binding domain-containing protein [Oceanobacillus jeddahense]